MAEVSKDCMTGACASEGLRWLTVLLPVIRPLSVVDDQWRTGQVCLVTLCLVSSDSRLPAFGLASAKLRPDVSLPNG
jgi:hypothetical protein